jgi:hypothetical protein
MLLPVQLPDSLPYFRGCVVRAIHVAVGTAIEPGSKIIDFSVDLGSGPSFGCAPVAHYRVSSIEGGEIRQIDVAVGQEIGPAAVIGLLSAERETPDPKPARVTIASVVHHQAWWDEL